MRNIFVLFLRLLDSRAIFWRPPVYYIEKLTDQKNMSMFQSCEVHRNFKVQIIISLCLSDNIKFQPTYSLRMNAKKHTGFTCSTFCMFPIQVPRMDYLWLILICVAFCCFEICVTYGYFISDSVLWAQMIYNKIWCPLEKLANLVNIIFQPKPTLAANGRHVGWNSAGSRTPPNEK